MRVRRAWLLLLGALIVSVACGRDDGDSGEKPSHGGDGGASAAMGGAAGVSITGGRSASGGAGMANGGAPAGEAGVGGDGGGGEGGGAEGGAPRGGAPSGGSAGSTSGSGGTPGGGTGGCGSDDCPRPQDGTCSVDGWCWVEPHPHGHALLKLAEAGGELFSVGHGGTIVHRDTSGRFTTEQWPGFPVLRGVSALAPDNVWAVGDAGLILHFDGENWSSVASPTTLPLNDVLAFAANDVWAVGGANMGNTSVIVHYDGREWTVDASILTSALFALGGSADDFWAGGYGSGGTLLRRTGGSWQYDPVLGAEGLQTITAIESWKNETYLSTSLGTLWKRFSNGWGRVNLNLGTVYPLRGLSSDADALWLISDMTVLRYDGQLTTERHRFKTYGPGSVLSTASGVFAAGQAGRIFSSSGADFSLVYGSDWGGAPDLAQVLPRAEDDIWWLGIHTLHFDGTSWSGGLFPDEVSNPTPEPLWKIQNETIYRWNGTTWEERRTFDNSPWAMWQPSGDEVWVGGEGGMLLHFDGDEWLTVDPGTRYGELFFEIHGSGPNDVWVLGDDFVLHFDGMRWQDEWRAHAAVQLVGLFSLRPDSVWVTDSYGGVHRWNGSGWTDYQTGAGWLGAVAAFADDDVWVGGSTTSFKSYVAHFDGRSWTQKTVPYAYDIATFAIQDEDTLYATGQGALLRFRR